ncbi:unnamed protein product [Microthlaspi erraticum]|uniref:Replication protein A 70 kDa DNA-binding subunit B/D first OB fold domain-containing protein n=2 Tax=Microthlaspi erraticum TaxID=1685480 RepID=A0A6D2IRU0_9BRAS|nr:unnamed protein product [Microthlaspi erraticum]CAA7032686.1 unnamed protein product [Microthlaspi erraticum]CAA7058023.1 unnamed protein product [Microthlaspi erraticum]
MATISKINELSPHRNGWTIRVRVLKKWSEMIDGGGDILRFLLVDDHLHEGDWKIITGFTVELSPPGFRFAMNHHTIIFTGNTNLQRSWGVITDHYMSFKNFRSIMNGVYTSNYPIDLLGYLDGVGEIEVVTDHTFTLGDNMQTSRVTFTIKDLEGRTLECEARGVLGIQLYNKWWRHGGTETFITMSDWMVYTDRGTNEMKIKDAGGISRFEFNALYQDVYEFRAAYFNESDPTGIESDGSSVELDWSP